MKPSERLSGGSKINQASAANRKTMTTMRNYIATIFFVLVPSMPAYAGTCDTTSTTGLNSAVGVQRACWHMDESAGATTMQDDSGFGNNGSLLNVITGHSSNPPPATSISATSSRASRRWPSCRTRIR